MASRGAPVGRKVGIEARVRIGSKRASRRVVIPVSLVALVVVAAGFPTVAAESGAADLSAVRETVQSMPPALPSKPPASRPDQGPLAAASVATAGHVTAPVRAPGCGRSIDVNLTTERLVASECGQVVIATAITSGRPGLRTPTGAFQVFLKERNVYFYSPWPAGDPNYYPPMFVAYAMEFLGGGYFLHTDPDEPAGAFGAGSQNGAYASHGCVHVPIAAMASLYSWATGGTPVDIHY